MNFELCGVFTCCDWNYYSFDMAFCPWFGASMMVDHPQRDEMQIRTPVVDGASWGSRTSWAKQGDNFSPTI
jgi:hypothetical protein